eukprot:5802333-Prymnesium_polylepis.1
MNPYPGIIQPRANPAPVGSRWSFAYAPVATHGAEARSGPSLSCPWLQGAGARQHAVHVRAG